MTDDDLMWLVIEQHHQIHHRADPRRVFEDEDDAHDWSEATTGDTYVTGVPKGSP